MPQDPWEQAAKEFKAQQSGTVTIPTDGRKTAPNEDWKLWAPDAKKTPIDTPHIGPIDYTTEMLSNIPSSAANLVGGVAHAVTHPKETAKTLGKVAVGTVQNMTPGYVTGDRPGYSEEANAAGKALKDRYGSLDAIGNTIKTDPVGVASDVSAVAGGVSGLARGAAAIPRLASTAGKVAEVAGAVSDATNPVNLVTKPVGAAMSGVSRPLVKSALGLTGKSERYGADPATAALEHTSGITPAAIEASAKSELARLTTRLNALVAQAKQAGNKANLQPAIDVIKDKIAKVIAANGSPNDLLAMRDQLTVANPGFAGATHPPSAPGALPPIDPLQDPDVFLPMKRQFAEDYTKFDAAVPMKSPTRRLGNQAYHELGTEFERAVPGADKVDDAIQNLVPVKNGAIRAKESVGPIQRSISRLTRPTGGAAAALILGPAGVAAQEALSSPTMKMAGARAAYGGGKAMSSPITSRSINAAGFAGTVAKHLSDAILNQQEQQ